MSKYYKSNDYDYGKGSSVDDVSSTTYSFGSKKQKYRLDNDDNTAGLSGDIWNDIQNDDDDDGDGANNASKNKKCGNGLSSCLYSIASFYMPSPRTKSYTSSSSFQDGNSGLADLDFTLSSNTEREVAAIHYKLRAGSTLVAAASLIFWCWAVYNTQHMAGDGQDLGMYSFFTTLLSSHYVLFRTSPPNRGGSVAVATPLMRVLVTASHALVCANYALGVLYAYTVGKSIYYIFGGYCIVFTVLWAWITFQGFQLLTNLQRHESELHRGKEEEEIEGEEYLF